MPRSKTELLTDTTLYLKDGCSYRVDMLPDEATFTVIGTHGVCHLILDTEVLGQVLPLLSKADETLRTAHADDLAYGICHSVTGNAYDPVTANLRERAGVTE